MRTLLQHHDGALSIADMVRHQPLKAGLEELVATLRVAQAVGATELASTESVMIQDRQGTWLKATIPHYLLTVEQFPEQIETLSL